LVLWDGAHIVPVLSLFSRLAFGMARRLFKEMYFPCDYSHYNVLLPWQCCTHIALNECAAPSRSMQITVALLFGSSFMYILAAGVYPGSVLGPLVAMSGIQVCGGYPAVRAAGLRKEHLVGGFWQF
jgi:hypothetical protein